MYKPWELILYALVLNLPFLPLMVYPFHHKFRFGKGVTYGALAALEALVIFISYCAISRGGSNSLYMLLCAALFLAVFRLLIGAHIGKIAFVNLIVYNCESLAVTLGKFIEWLVVPEYAAQYYCWTYSAFTLLAEAVLVPLVCLLFRAEVQKAMDDEHSMLWGYLWFVPAIFSVILSINAFGLFSVESLQMCSEQRYVYSVVFVNAGMLFICHMVFQFVQEEMENAQMKLANLSLRTLNKQYDDLNKRVEEARRAQHDLRHHFVTLSALAEKGNIDEVKDYLRQYSSYTDSEGPLHYCGNMTANALFAFYAQAAHEAGIEYSVTAALSEHDTGITDVDLTVVLGNLLENALEACRRQNAGTKKWIAANAYVSGNAFFLVVDNSYGDELHRDAEGYFLSVKHEGRGVGIESVKSVVQRYGGEFRASEEEGKFCVSLVMYMPQTPEESEKEA